MHSKKTQRAGDAEYGAKRGDCEEVVVAPPRRLVRRRKSTGSKCRRRGDSLRCLAKVSVAAVAAGEICSAAAAAGSFGAQDRS